jgi:transcriptional regulator with XRE-family HTH domain
MKPRDLRVYRARHGLTQQQLHDRIQDALEEPRCSHGATVISRWERGAKPIPGWLRIVMQYITPEGV